METTLRSAAEVAELPRLADDADVKTVVVSRSCTTAGARPRIEETPAGEPAVVRQVELPLGPSPRRLRSPPRARARGGLLRSARAAAKVSLVLDATLADDAPSVSSIIDARQRVPAKSALRSLGVDPETATAIDKGVSPVVHIGGALFHSGSLDAAVRAVTVLRAMSATLRVHASRSVLAQMGEAPAAAAPEPAPSWISKILVLAEGDAFSIVVRFAEDLALEGVLGMLGYEGVTTGAADGRVIAAIPATTLEPPVESPGTWSA